MSNHKFDILRGGGYTTVLVDGEVGLTVADNKFWDVIGIDGKSQWLFERLTRRLLPPLKKDDKGRWLPRGTATLPPQQ